MDHIIITKLDQTQPSLETSSISLTDDPFAENFETYFCAGGHSFTLSFVRAIRPPAYFECPHCTALAVNTPISLNNEESVEEELATISDTQNTFVFVGA